MCVLGARTLLYPEYRGNGVLASLGNIVENAHVGLLFLGFSGDRIGLHVNGHARIVDNEDLVARSGELPDAVLAGLLDSGGRRPERWVEVDVVEAYLHCSEHIPRMVRDADDRQAWGTDDVVRKGGDHLKAKHSPRPWVQAPAVAGTATGDGAAALP
jgi:uncharacterized protein